jgi:hypothetical protein
MSNAFSKIFTVDHLSDMVDSYSQRPKIIAPGAGAFVAVISSLVEQASITRLNRLSPLKGTSAVATFTFRDSAIITQASGAPDTGHRSLSTSKQSYLRLKCEKTMSARKQEHNQAQKLQSKVRIPTPVIYSRGEKWFPRFAVQKASSPKT